jgi:hypothetical protein
MFVIFAVQFAGGVTSYVYRDHFDQRLEANMRSLMNEYYPPENNNVKVELNATEAWDMLQIDVSAF